jgi:alpha-L-rhamnosidase
MKTNEFRKFNAWRSTVRHTLHSCLLLCAAVPLAADGALVTWDGGATTNNWSAGANWVGDVVPPSNGTASVRFSGTARLSMNVDLNNPWNLSDIAFNGGQAVGAYVIGGNRLTFSSAGALTIQDSAATPQTINNAVTFNAASTTVWLGANKRIVAGGAWNSSNPLFVLGGGNGGCILEVAATGSITAGTLEVSAANSYSWASQGPTLQLDHGNALADTLTLKLTPKSDLSKYPKLNLAFTGTETVAGLVLNGVTQAAGNYNATSHPAYFMGAGTLGVGAGGGGGTGTATAVGLKCEYQVNPIGLDTTQPRFYWQMQDTRRGAKQTSYQIIVASSESVLASNRGDVWDSGRVQSDQSTHVVYAGPALASRKRYHWKVKIWDAGAVASAWSSPAFFEMGFLAPTDWTARWIGPVANQSYVAPLPFFGDWIWSTTAQTRVYFRGVLNLPTDTDVEWAEVNFAVRKQATVFINGIKIGDHSGTAWIKNAAADKALKRGRNIIAVDASEPAGAGGFILGLQASMKNGTTAQFGTGNTWRCSPTVTTGWLTDPYDDSQWTAAKAIAKAGEPPWTDLGSQPVEIRSFYMRKDFATPTQPVRARLYIAGVGLYEAWINGQRVSDEIFAPGWTDYAKRIQYRTYDVTSKIKTGNNVIGAHFGTGWWRFLTFAGWGQMLRAQLEIDMSDGTKQVIVTDNTWKATPSPVLANSFYGGQSYDARLEIPGWNTTQVNASTWGGTTYPNPTTTNIVAQKGPPILATRELRAKTITQIYPKVYIFDFGQNSAGRCRIRIRNAVAGTRIQVRHAEVLQPDGRLYTENYRTAKVTDVYYCKGGAEEIWEPNFTYRGFRYAELRGYAGTVDAETLVFRVIHSAPEEVGAFTSSNPLINSIQSNIVWTQRSNLYSVPTDCPTRNERLGWFGDAQTFAATSHWNMDMTAFYAKWMTDIIDAQFTDGGMPELAPFSKSLSYGKGPAAAGWADAITVIPWTAWQFSGDTRIISENYAGMKKWVEYMRARAVNDIYEGLGPGDWVATEVSPKEPIGCAYYYWSTRLLSQMAGAIGNQTDASTYGSLADRIAVAFNGKYLNTSTNDYPGGSQTAKAIPLAFGITPADKRAAVGAKLVANIAARGNHLSTGFLGTPALAPALTNTGNHSVAYTVATQRTYPSWGYAVDKGATTLWELWNSDTAGPSMNSRNHFALGAIGQWFYEELAGIHPASPGFKTIRIQPRPVGDLTSAEGTHKSFYGTIKSKWSISSGVLTFTAEVPANTTAQVFVPMLGKPAGTVSEGGTAIVRGGASVGTVPGLQFSRMEGDFSVFAAGAGSYSFSVTP